MQYYFMILAAVILLALQFATNKAYGLRRGNSAKASLVFSTFAGFASAAVSAVIALITKQGIEITPFSLVMAALVALFCCSYTFIGFKIMALGSLSVFTMFLMLGGVILPYIYGLIRLGEPATPAKIIGIILLTVSLAFPVLAREKNGRSSIVFFLLCAAVFLLNGGVSITSKIHQITTSFDTVNSASFSLLSNLMNAVISTVGLIIVTAASKNKTEKSSEDKRDGTLIKASHVVIALIIIANAACNGVSYMLQLVSAGQVPASVMYPMMTGGSMVLSAIAGRIFFGEKPDKISLIGLIISFAATFLFLF